MNNKKNYDNTGRWDQFLPPDAIVNQRVKSRYLGAYKTLLTLTAMIACIAPFYVWVRGPMAWDEVVAAVVAISGPLLGIISIRISANLVFGMLLTTVFTTAAFFDLACHTGGLSSFVIPWFLTNLAVQGLFGSKPAFTPPTVY